MAGRTTKSRKQLSRGRGRVDKAVAGAHSDAAAESMLWSVARPRPRPGQRCDRPGDHGPQTAHAPFPPWGVVRSGIPNGRPAWPRPRRRRPPRPCRGVVICGGPRSSTRPRWPRLQASSTATSPAAVPARSSVCCKNDLPRPLPRPCLGRRTKRPSRGPLADPAQPCQRGLRSPQQSRGRTHPLPPTAILSATTSPLHQSLPGTSTEDDGLRGLFPKPRSQGRLLLPLFNPARLRAPASLDARTCVERRTTDKRPRVKRRTAEKCSCVKRRTVDERRCKRKTSRRNQRRPTRPGRRTRHGTSASTQTRRKAGEGPPRHAIVSISAPKRPGGDPPRPVASADQRGAEGECPIAASRKRRRAAPPR